MAASSERYSIYGLCIETDYRFCTPLGHDRGIRDDVVRFTYRGPVRERELRRAERIWLSAERNRYGESGVQLYSAGARYIMRFPRVADFIISSETIECELFDRRFRYMVEICLFGHVLAYFLELAGITVVHSGAVVVDDRAVLLVGDHGSGKSTLVASLVGSGFPLLSDDIAAVETAPGAIICNAGPPRLKLNTEQLDRFVGSGEGFRDVHPAFDKRSVPVDALGDYHADSVPVASIYLLHRETNYEQHDSGVSIGASPVSLCRLSPGAALVELVQHSFLAELLDASVSREGRLRRLARIAAQVPVKRVRFTSGYDHLARVGEAIIGDFRVGRTPSRTP